MQISKTELNRLERTFFHQHAQRLYKGRHVTLGPSDENSASATVRDYQFVYKPVVWRDQMGELNSECGCKSYVAPCAHVVALMYAIHSESRNGNGLNPPALTWQDYLKNVPALPEREIPGKRAMTWELMFFLRTNVAKWFLSPASTYIKKNGDFGQRSRVAFDYSGNLKKVSATASETKALNYLDKLGRNSDEYNRSYYYSYYSRSLQETYEFDFAEEAGALLNLLTHSRLYLDNGDEMPERVLVARDRAKLSFHVERFGESAPLQYRLLPRITRFDGSSSTRQNHTEDFDHNYRLLTVSPIWLLKGNLLITLDSALPATFLLPFTRSGFQLLIPQDQLNDFLQAFAPHVQDRAHIVLPEGVELQAAREITGRRLYLREHHETLCIEVKFVYDQAVEVDTLRGLETSLTENHQVWRVQRDHQAEAAAFETLYSHGLALAENQQHCVPVGEPLSWLFDELPKLAQEGFEIFGEKELARHRINRAAPKVNVSLSSEIDWFDLKVEIDYDGVLLSLAELRTAIRKQNSFVKLADGSQARLPEEWQKRFRHFFNFAETQNSKARIASAHALLVDSLFDEVAEKRYDEAFRKRLAKLKDFKGIQDVPVPAGFRGELRPYQQAGLNWLGFLQEYGFNGCLADDMGLGKTIQTLALLAREAENANGSSKTLAQKRNGKSSGHANGVSVTSGKRPTSLIVAPLSVIFNWEKECSRFTPHLRVLVHHGLERARDCADFHEYDFVLTTYSTMRLDIEFLKDFQFHYIVLDESQNIKNPEAQTAKAANILQSRHRLVLSGTPVENNTLELWSQFSFLNPGMLGSRHYFQGAFAAPIERYGDEESATLLKKMISPFLLRRTKEIVARELPPKSEQVYYCAMSKTQAKLYQQVRDHYRAEIMNLIDTTGLQDARFKVLQGLTKLRQLACHPSLIFDEGEQESGKFEAFLEMLQDILAGGHKVLVFSQFVRMLNLMAQQLKKDGIAFEMLTGHTRDRETRVTRFQNDPKLKAFLISLKAGGLGLNLTAADYVIVYDPWWNPAAERQAIDRAHRIGQDKSVFAYKMITRDTVEEKILELQKRKQNLVSQLITTDSGLFKHLTAEDIRGLFS
ncbi:serine/threonine protein kinase [candidate division KSB1 bacterium]|nr:MAG: serine/threonine protein kinase [candidate division KSB1 bacterium]MBC6949880.1 serine/threonine protein kinase [candidate division KSB1 bacterium]MCE7943215.1 serine/threonine protein kinase [Chlorobi bacterium CHB1]MDL1877557.1 serine/threonine protein kinase [Cytophagia bacterium CHB2]